MWLDIMNDKIWAHSGESVTYTQWAPHEPMASDEQCAGLLDSREWIDIFCTRMYSYICEKETHG